MKKIRVLIFPAGAENALEIYYAIKDNINIEVFGASGKSDHAKFVYDSAHYFEDDFYINNESFVEKFRGLLVKNKIDVLIPTHDSIALYFAKNATEFPVKILTATEETALICREKKRTFLKFLSYDFCPRIYERIEDIKASDLPLFVKPNVGEGAKGVQLINTIEDLQKVDVDNMVICEYLPGQEYTVDCFTNCNGTLCYCGIRTRERIQMGIAFRSRTLPLPPEIKEMANIINQNLHFFGGWFFQVKCTNDNQYKLMEISCRMAGTMTLHRHKGINFALLGIFESLGISTEYIELPCEITLDRCLDASYSIDYDYKKVYIDYDDTIISNGYVNTNIITFLYQSKKKGKEIFLLTRHDGDLEKDMDEKIVPLKLFTDIIHISFEQSKLPYIEPYKSIFIDNSFKERKEVFNAYKIPVFDVDAVDMLIQK